MTSYTNTFTGAPIQVTPTSYRAVTIAVNTTLSWPENNEDDANVTADTMEVTASSASLSLIMPPANQVSNGKAILIRNVGSNAFTVKDNAGGTIQSISAGNVFWVYVKDNSTVAGTWSAFQFGTGTSAANAADLDGLGLTAISTLLNVALPVTSFNSTTTLDANSRAGLQNWTGGVGTFNLTAAATLGNNWFVLVKNSGSGALTIDPNGAELIDGVSTLTLNSGESCIVVCTGSAFLSISKNSVMTISFTRLVKSVAGSSDVTLTSSEAGFDIQEYTGVLTGNINVIVPTAVSRWWVYNNTTGAFTLTVKTAAGTGIAVTQASRTILHCDGTNVVYSINTTSGTVTNIATGTGLSGGPITTTGTINLANTAVSSGSYGSAAGIPSFTVDAQGRLTAAANVTEPAGIISINGGQLAGFRNVLINGDFKIWQRNTSYSLTNSLAYGAADRWWSLMSSSAAGVSNRDSSVPTPSSTLQAFQYSMKVGRNNGSSNTNNISIGQTIESANAICLAGKKATISFYAKAGANYSSSGSVLNVAVPTGTGIDEGSSAGFVGGWTGYINTSITPGNVTLTTSWQRFSITTTAELPTNISEMLCLFQYTPTGTAGADDNFYITGIQIESGNTATLFEFRPFQTELDLCMRYYEKSFPYSTAPAQNAGTTGAISILQNAGASTATSCGWIPFKVQKRVNPSTTLYNPSAANAEIRNLSNANDWTSTSINLGPFQNGFGLSGTTSAGSGVASLSCVHYSTDAEL